MEKKLENDRSSIAYSSVHDSQCRINWQGGDFAHSDFPDKVVFDYVKVYERKD